MGGELYDPAQRDSHYQGNVAQYLVDLHDANACFNFCGGMMFQLSLTQKLRDHLSKVGRHGISASEGRLVLLGFVNFENRT